VASRTSSPPARIPRFRWLIWGAAALLGIGAGAALFALRSSNSTSTPTAAGPATTWAAGTRRAPAFRLADQSGAPVSLGGYRGRPVIVTFIDPLCRNYCPIEASRLDNVVRNLPAASRPAIVAVSVNVEGNARRYLVQDIRKWRLGSTWRWGVGRPATLASVWRKYGIGVLVTRKKIAGVAVDEVTHTEAAYVVDPNGFERALYLWPFTAADLRSTLLRLRG
jgi:cytochrome oxidase Cu insertion factor (SCO1/SenC/PrrC family)